MSASVLQPGGAQTPVGQLPFLQLPGRHVFEARAARLETLSQDHALGDYLRFLAGIACAQHSALLELRDLPLPTAGQLARCRHHRLPPLGPAGWERAPAWRAVLRDIVEACQDQPLPGPARAALAQLRNADDADLERLATALLDGNRPAIDAAHTPWVGAALQVIWLHALTALGADALVRLEAPHRCPACGSAPTASLVHIGGTAQGLRYLHCSLCGLAWHLVRVKCPCCASTQGIGYYGLEGRDVAIKAECCEACHSYLKIFYMDKDPLVDAVADDVASLTLDLLTAELGYARSGVNYFMTGGDA